MIVWKAAFPGDLLDAKQTNKTKIKKINCKHECSWKEAERELFQWGRGLPPWEQWELNGMSALLCIHLSDRKKAMTIWWGIWVLTLRRQAFFSVSEYVLKFSFKKKGGWGRFFSYCLIHLIYDKTAWDFKIKNIIQRDFCTKHLSSNLPYM